MNKDEAEVVIKDTIEFANKEIETNKKKARRYIIGLVFVFVLIIVAGIVFIRLNTPANNDETNIATVRDYSQNADGTWVCEGSPYKYKYKLEITGRMPNASRDSTFVYLSNSEDITLEQAWKAAGFSSNMNDYFDIEDAVLVEMSTE